MKKMFEMLLPLIVMTNWAVGLLILRMVRYGSSYYDFLLWNTFLAWVPILVSLPAYALIVKKKLTIPRIVIPFIYIVWLLFLPNAPYLITDFVHLRIRGIVPLWYDILLLFSFALLGLFQFEYSLIQMRAVIKATFAKHVYIYIVPVTIVLMSIGIYVGRFLRWNSWEVVTHPGMLIREAYQVVTTPYLLHTAITYTVGTIILLSLFHYLVHTVGKLARME